LYQNIFSRDGAYPFLNQVISWFNLDFGIETCFFNGMDSYSKVWLQYAFPVGLWAIIFIIFVISKISNRFSHLKLTSVLSILLLLSYTKICRTVFDALRFRVVQVNCESGQISQLLLWNEDPSLQYARGIHFYLFLFSLAMLLLFCLPYTFYLIFHQVFRKFCQYCPKNEGNNTGCQKCIYKCLKILTEILDQVFRKFCQYCPKNEGNNTGCQKCIYECLKILIEILDASNTQIKEKCRFWTGLRLLLRLPPLISVALFGSLIENKFILLTELVAILAIMIFLEVIVDGVYEQKFLNIIEMWLQLNLIVMVALSNTIHGKEESKIWFSCFIFIFFCTFIISLICSVIKNKIIPLIRFFFCKYMYYMYYYY
jgi:hypothetical protein